MNKHFVIDPAGNKHTRNSRNRVYSHAILVKPSYEKSIAETERSFAPGGALYQVYRSNFAYYSRINDPKVEGHTADTYVARERARYLAVDKQRLADGEFDRWECRGWAGRTDLAEKAAAQHFNPDRHEDYAVVEAQLA